MPSLPEENGAREEPRRVTALRAAPSPLAQLKQRALMLAVVSLGGALLALAAGALRPARFRATASLLVSEPRLSGSSAVDFNLTPVRSYAPLAASPSLAAPCRAALGHDGAVRVRIPENTRILELTAEDASGASAAEFVNCVAGRAIEENRRINAELARSGAAPAAAALEAARADLAVAEGRMAEGRASAHLESRRAELRAAADGVDAGAEEERRALLAAAEAGARRAAFPEGSADARNAAAEEAGARSRAHAAAGLREAAARRLAVLEQEVAASEQRLEALRRSLSQAEGATSEVARRNATASLDASAKGFDLVLVAPAVPPLRPTRPPLLALAAAGAAIALAFGTLLTLAR